MGGFLRDVNIAIFGLFGYGQLTVNSHFNGFWLLAVNCK